MMLLFDQEYPELVCCIGIVKNADGFTNFTSRDKVQNLSTEIKSVF